MIKLFETDNNNLNKIKVIGVGGCGCNSINYLVKNNLSNVELIGINTDIQSLENCMVNRKIQIGVNVCGGIGAGGDPELGKEALKENIDLIRMTLENTDLLFLTAGLGGGTGTGATPLIAKLAHEMGILTIAVVTKPFKFEGKRRMDYAEEGLRELKKYADTLIVIHNQKLKDVIEPNTTILDAFSKVDKILLDTVKGITDLITNSGYINVDLADLRKILSNMGLALVGIGEEEGEDRAKNAFEKALNYPLLEDISIHGAKSILINFTGGKDLTIQEIDKVNTFIFEKADREANIIWGYVIDENYNGKIKITIIVTGFENYPTPQKAYSEDDTNSVAVEEFNASNELVAEKIAERTAHSIEENYSDSIDTISIPSPKEFIDEITQADTDKISNPVIEESNKETNLYEQPYNLNYWEHKENNDIIPPFRKRNFNFNYIRKTPQDIGFTFDKENNQFPLIINKIKIEELSLET